MTNEEAIRRIECHMEVHRIGEYPHIKLAAALNMALDALRAQQESVKPLGGEAAPDLSGPEARPRLDRSRWEGCWNCNNPNARKLTLRHGREYCPAVGSPSPGKLGQSWGEELEVRRYEKI